MNTEDDFAFAAVADDDDTFAFAPEVTEDVLGGGGDGDEAPAQTSATAVGGPGAVGGSSQQQHSRGPASIAATDVPEDAPEVDVAALFPNADPNVKPVIVGTVAIADVGCGLDLRDLACGARNVEYLPKKSVAATMRIRDPQCAALIRTSGVFSVIGASNIGAARQGAELCARIIRQVLQLENLKTFKFRIRSVMARFDLKHPVRLDELHNAHPDICSYEPETFCGCVVKLRGPLSNPWAVSASVYVSGKVTIIGAKSRKELDNAFRTLLPILAPHVKK